jgi:membrane protein implicated in regulation of membrane protease activity
MVVFWLIVAVFCFVTEGFTQKFMAIWFSIGALAALLTATLDAHPGTQILVFVFASGLLLLSTRTMVNEYLAIKAQNSDDAKKMPGVTCQVVEPIDNVEGTGVIEYNGRNWEARAECRTRFEPGTRVTVARMAKGVAYVEEAPPEEPEPEIDPETGEPLQPEEALPDAESEEGAVFEYSTDT